jgi:acetylornithine deacetylase/succinyl-diaminopimelate desuccinylase-like protein
MEQAVATLVNWCNSQPISGMKIDIIRLPKRTPLIFIEISGTLQETVLLYGHLDKQPEMSGWAEDLGPWQPVRKGDLLYGRGSADDGYAIFSSLSAIMSLQQAHIPHARCVIVIEACEESGSYDLPFYIEHLKERVGCPSLVVCLDSGAGNYEQLWSTTSLRGVITGNLTVSVLSEGIHSGISGGVVPSSFRILRQLLSRIEDEVTGKILLSELNTHIPQHRREQMKMAAQVLGKTIYETLPFLDGVEPITSDLTELILNQTWRPALSMTGAEGFPNLELAGNVLRPKTACKLSIRIPPNCSAEEAGQAVKKALEINPPYGAKVSFELEPVGPGWDAPELAPWLEQATEQASQTYFKKPAVYMGIGASIPFMGMLGKKFPEAQFLITGVLGPHSNAHGPNEFLHIAYAKKVTACIAHVVAKHYDYFSHKNGG